VRQHPHQGGEGQQHAQGQQPVSEEEALQADDQFLDHVGVSCLGRGAGEAPRPGLAGQNE
jgi:hypothetical protein